VFCPWPISERLFSSGAVGSALGMFQATFRRAGPGWARRRIIAVSRMLRRHLLALFQLPSSHSLQVLPTDT